MWIVRKEIIGEFVTIDKFKYFYDALKYVDEQKSKGIYDSIEMWED
jgi:hypothetical protein